MVAFYRFVAITFACVKIANLQQRSNVFRIGFQDLFKLGDSAIVQALCGVFLRVLKRLGAVLGHNVSGLLAVL